MSALQERRPSIKIEDLNKNENQKEESAPFEVLE